MSEKEVDLASVYLDKNGGPNFTREKKTIRRLAILLLPVIGIVALATLYLGYIQMREVAAGVSPTRYYAIEVLNEKDSYCPGDILSYQIKVDDLRDSATLLLTTGFVDADTDMPVQLKGPTTNGAVALITQINIREDCSE